MIRWDEIVNHIWPDLLTHGRPRATAAWKGNGYKRAWNIAQPWREKKKNEYRWGEQLGASHSPIPLWEKGICAAREQPEEKRKSNPDYERKRILLKTMGNVEESSR